MDVSTQVASSWGAFVAWMAAALVPCIAAYNMAAVAAPVVLQEAAALA